MAQEVKVIRTFATSNYAVVKWDRGRYTEWVACWSPWVKEGEEERRPCSSDVDETRTMYWGQGHYFTTPEDALCYAFDREEEAIIEYLQRASDLAKQINNRLREVEAKLNAKMGIDPDEEI